MNFFEFVASLYPHSICQFWSIYLHI